MSLFESSTHSFVIKIWLEETTTESGQIVWRGQIKHVPSGKPSGLRDLSGIALFVMPYLEAMGVEPDLEWKVIRWLKRWKRFLKAIR